MRRSAFWITCKSTPHRVGQRKGLPLTESREPRKLIHVRPSIILNLSTSFSTFTVNNGGQEESTSPSSKRRDSDMDGILTLGLFEDTLHEMTQHLEDLSSFWRARSVDFPDPSPDRPSPITTMETFYALNIDADVIHEHRETISACLDTLGTYARDAPSERRVKGRWGRWREWLKGS